MDSGTVCELDQIAVPLQAGLRTQEYPAGEHKNINMLDTLSQLPSSLFVSSI